MAAKVKKVAIVGMGIAGVSALREWTKQKESNPGIEITAFGDADTFGRGKPYQKEDEIVIMNQPADLATIIPEKKYDFVDWLKENKGEENPSKGYFPRALFGQYLYERMDEWRRQSKARTIEEEVREINRLDNGKFQVKSISYEDTFDVVHLCIGSAPYEDHYDLFGHDHFIFNPFPMNKNLANIPKNSRLAVLGTGLTSIDILRYINRYRPDLDLSFYSHSGRFKTARGETIHFDYQYFTDENIKAAKAENNGFISLDTYFDWFRKELKYQGVVLSDNWINQAFGSKKEIQNHLTDDHELGVVQTLILGMDRFLSEIWMALTEKDKERFFKEYYEEWDKIRSSFPKESGEILVKVWEEERIKVFADVLDVKKNSDSFKILLKDQESQSADYLINATGSKKKVDFNLTRMPLLQHLLNHRIVQAETFGGLEVTVPELSALSQKYGVLDRLKVHGPLISGIQFGNNSIDIISEGVQRAVEDIMQLK